MNKNLRTFLIATGVFFLIEIVCGELQLSAMLSIKTIISEIPKLFSFILELIILSSVFGIPTGFNFDFKKKSGEIEEEIANTED